MESEQKCENKGIGRYKEIKEKLTKVGKTVTSYLSGVHTRVTEHNYGAYSTI
jgi:hypothetical protein